MKKRRGLTLALSKGEGGRKVRWLLALLLLLAVDSINAQEDEKYSADDTVSAITAPAYIENPAKYLKNIDSSKIPTGILIDRVKFRKDIGDFNGKSRVKTCDYYIWKRLYNNCKFASNDTGLIPNIDNMRNIAVSMECAEDRMFAIGISNMIYNKIDDKAYRNGKFVEMDSTLSTTDTSKMLFKTNRVIAASLFTAKVYGEDIKFLASPMFYYTNDTNWLIKKIDIDFDDGKGFIDIKPDEPVVIQYGNESKYIMAKIKITFLDKTRNKKQIIRHSNFTFLYSGSDAIPEPSKLSNKKSTGCSQTIYLPVNTTGDSWYQYRNDYQYETWEYATSFKLYSEEDYWRREPGTYSIEGNIRFANSNTSGKLRKAIIISDAFDPGNYWNYYANHMEYDPDPKIYDPRGLFDIFDGKRSAWTDPSDYDGGLAWDLFMFCNYDLVFINYARGTGDIPTNAGKDYGMEGFLDYLNANYRDNQTEEFILVGPSMGGIISRYCLTSMEAALKEHHVKMWFSFDSPQEGANIPLGLQLGLHYLQSGITGLLLTIFGQNLTEPLESDAAKQMLLQHYIGMGYPSPPNGVVVGNSYQEEFYNTLRQKGYPKYSKNIAISNGGLGLLYPDAEEYRTLNFDRLTLKIEGFYSHNTAGSYKIFNGHNTDGLDNDYTIYTSGQIGMDNAPGGYNTALYTFNKNEKNGDYAREHCTEIWQQKATFMPTVNAFGIIPTRENVHKTWQDINLSETPFDVIHGMSAYGNEEHVRVSDKTSTWLQNDVLKVERNNLQKPFPRSVPYTETESMPCLYTANNTVTFGSTTGSNFILKAANTNGPGADVKVVAGTSIKFLPGFKVESGAKIHAKCGTVVNGSQKKAAIIKNNPKVTYLDPSPYNNKVFDYSGNETPVLIAEKRLNQTSFKIYPNPATDKLYIEFTGQWVGNTKVELRNVYGQSVISEIIGTTGTQVIDISQIPLGMYVVSILNREKSTIQKIIKQ